MHRTEPQAPAQPQKSVQPQVAEQPQVAGQPRTPGLPDGDASLLAFERRAWHHAGAKEEAIRVELGLSAARYYQLLNAVIDSPAALRHDPMLIRRLRRLREGRHRGAISGLTGDDAEG